MSYPTLDNSVVFSLGNGGFKKSPQFNTVKQKTAAGRTPYTVALMPYGTWAFEADLSHTPGDEATATSVYALFVGLFMQTNGGAGFWYFTDPNDNAVTQATSVMLNVTSGAATPMGQTGDGSSKQFQLARSIAGGTDVLQNVSNVAVFVNGVQKTPSTDYSISSSGVVTFTAAPANTATLTWSGNFQFLCMFSEDTLDDLALVAFNTTDELHSCSTIKFESVFI